MIMIAYNLKSIKLRSRSTNKSWYYIFKSRGLTQCWRYSNSDSFFEVGYYKCLSSSNKIFVSK
jgi:hypothetical protein